MADLGFSIVMGFVAGLVLGAMGIYLWMQARQAAVNERVKFLTDEVSRYNQDEKDRQAQLQQLTEVNDTLKGENQGLKKDMAHLQASHQEKLQLLEEAKTRFADAFKALSSEALNKNNAAFLQLAKENFEKSQESATHEFDNRQKAFDVLGKQLQEKLKAMEEGMTKMDQDRARLNQRLDSLHQETKTLSTALRRPHVRGRWGEEQLERILEYAGMQENCDYVKQAHLATDKGNLRPDVVINLPNGRQIAVDAKTPIESYLDAADATDENRREDCLKNHARLVRKHIQDLKKKDYWTHLEASPDFIVMFIPGENFYMAAMQFDPTLVDYAAQNNVLVASPMSLISLLRTVACAWQEERMAKNAEEIRDLGKRLYESLCTYTNHMSSLGKSLNSATKHFNSAVGSLDRSVLKPAEKFQQMGVGSSKSLPQLDPVEETPRAVETREPIAAVSVSDEP